jgi:hypothetical protein
MTTYTPNFGLALPDFRQGPWHDQINNDITKIDALLFSALSGANVAVWQNDTDYNEGETVVDDTDASIWLCAVEHTSAATPTTFAEDRLANPTYWTRLLTGFAPRGEWTNATNYFPYDLVYDSHLGIMALCSTKHTSIAVGNIKDDAIYWAFLIDMSNADLSTAIAVTYDGTTSGLDADNVQEAIDVLETQIISLNNVNIMQGEQIGAIPMSGGHPVKSLQQQVDDLSARVTSTEDRLHNHDLAYNNQQNFNTGIQSQVTALQAQVNAIPTSTFPVGTRMVFIQAAPPTGWTINGAYNDRAIRLVSGATGGNAGGSVGFSGIFGRTATDNAGIAGGNMPSHNHGGGGVKTATPTGDYIVVPVLGADTFIYHYFTPIVTQGSDVPHAHGIEMRLAYVDACVGQKS